MTSQSVGPHGLNLSMVRVEKARSVPAADAELQKDGASTCGGSHSQRVESVTGQVARLQVRDDRTGDAGAGREVSLTPTAPVAQGTEHPTDLRIAHRLKTS
jgi:hypothetical protein